MKKTLEDGKISYAFELEEYGENDHPTQIYMQIQCNLNKNSNVILHRNRTNSIKGYGGTTTKKQGRTKKS